MDKLHDWSDIEADVYFLTTDEGGRSGYAASGYRPQFYHRKQDWDSVVVSHGHVKMLPGSRYSVSISFLSPHMIVDGLGVGDDFKLREGHRVVRRGVVTKIVDLEKSAERERDANQPT